jgi:hypothetical protein
MRTELNINNNIYKSRNNNTSFKGTGKLLTKAADIFIKSQENLSSTRFIQDTATNWAPKAIFARSKADFAEMSFLEFIESGIFYFASPIFGEKLFRNKLFKNIQPNGIKETINKQIPKTVNEITKNSGLTDEIKKRTISSKAGIILACTAIPVAEYTLSFAKNLFTLKTFKKSNFNSIANLDKGTNNEPEDINQQQKVEKNSKNQLKRAAIISTAGVAAGILLAVNGHKSDKLQNIAKAIIEPGKAAASGLGKIGIKNEKLKNTISKFSLDFANDNGKLALSKGQLALTAILGLLGYSKAAEDRGKLDVAEVWTRVPLVVFYTIFGSELLEKGFTKILEKKKIFPDIVKRSANGKLQTPLRSELPKLAENISKVKNTSVTKELSRLTKEKALVTAVPYAFSLLFMGFTLSGITRLWTQYRYNKFHKEKADKQLEELNTNNYFKTPEIFNDFNIFNSVKY